MMMVILMIFFQHLEDIGMEYDDGDSDDISFSISKISGWNMMMVILMIFLLASQRYQDGI